MDFASSDDYAAYVRDHIAVGMHVRCYRSYDEVNEGDVGPVVQLDRDGLHDFNVQVRHFDIFWNFLNWKT